MTFAKDLARLLSAFYGLRVSRGVTSFAMQKRRVSPVAQATTVAKKRSLWALDFNDIANEVPYLREELSKGDVE